MKIVNTRFELINPFDRWDYFRNLGCVSGLLTLNTAWELEHTYYSPMLLDWDIQISHKQDHAGVSITFGLLGYGIHFRIYDTRHWDNVRETWVEYSQT